MSDRGAALRPGPSLWVCRRRLRREMWHLWQELWRVHAGDDADPSVAEAGGLPGRPYLGFLEEAFERLAEIEAETPENTA